MNFTKRELYIKSLFFPKHTNELVAESISKKISSFGDRFGFVGDQGNDERRKHKYDVWIALQVKDEMKNPDPSGVSILDRQEELFRILDWAIQTKVNLTQFSFGSALLEHGKWISIIAKSGAIRPEPIDKNRIIYTCSNGYFMYILSAYDLEFEASVMGHCVGGSNYKSKIRNNRSVIISLRDAKNQPHITIEVGLKPSYTGKMIGTVLQQQGKVNLSPSEKYHAALREFVLFNNNSLSEEDVDFLTSDH